MELSTYQRAIIDFAENSTENLVIEAVAGSGKSTTMELVSRALTARGKSVLLLAFNKAIAEALKARGLNASTFHGLCCGPVLRSVGGGIVTDKLRGLLQDNLTANEFAECGSAAMRLVGLAKQAGIGAIVADNEEGWMNLIERHGIDGPLEGRLIEISRKLLEASTRTKGVDFDDMLYLAVKRGVVLPQYDVLIVDEAQDTNAIQREIIRKTVGAAGRLIAVGDSRQAIYGFRGADSGAMEALRTEFAATSLPLSITYRCPSRVVELAQKWVPEIEARQGAPDGIVREGEVSEAAPGDMILCRRTAPLVKACYNLIASGIPARIKGREIGAKLVQVIKKMKAKSTDDLVDKLEDFRAKEVARLTARFGRLSPQVDAVGDQVEAIQTMASVVASVRVLVEKIESMFSDADGRGAVTLSTVHKAKGLEGDRVFILDLFDVAPWATQDWQKQEEGNLRYVAVTRAKKELVLA